MSKYWVVKLRIKLLISRGMQRSQRGRMRSRDRQLSHFIPSPCRWCQTSSLWIRHPDDLRCRCLSQILSLIHRDHPTQWRVLGFRVQSPIGLVGQCTICLLYNNFCLQVFPSWRHTRFVRNWVRTKDGTPSIQWERMSKSQDLQSRSLHTSDHILVWSRWRQAVKQSCISYSNLF